MSIIYRKSMDALYLVCVGIAGTALVLISAVMPWGVYTRYVLNRAASWPEPMAVLLTIVLTFIGAAACYRSGNHMSVSVLVRMLTGPRQRLAEFSAEALCRCAGRVHDHLRQQALRRDLAPDIADFPAFRSGMTYLPIPIGGAITLLFVIERMLLGPPPAELDPRRRHASAS